MQGRRGDLPGGCATLAGEHVCVPRVTVDGQKLTDLAVLHGIITAAAGPGGLHLPLRSSRAIRSGIADAVFQRLLRLEAIRAGVNVTNAQARAFAQHELELYEQRPSQARSQGIRIPAGMTARQYFLSPRTVAGYRDGMVVGQERDRILRAHPSMPRALAFREWFRARLPHHRVTINGSAPDSALADVLPVNL
jgi:hypothetical protein